MTDKETGELRRRYKPDRTNITAVYGCYVSGSGEILSEFRQPVALMSEEDKEKYLALLKKVLSGAADKNRLDLAFRTAQVADSDEHRLLMKLIGLKHFNRDQHIRVTFDPELITVYEKASEKLIKRSIVKD